MNSQKNDLIQSIILTVIGAYLGFVIGGKIGDYLDVQTLNQLGISKRSVSYYWSIRLSVVGVILGIIAGAIAGYIVASKKNS